MQRSIINVLRIAFALLILFLGITTIINRPIAQTNILSAIFAKNENSQLIIDLSNKFSSKINLIVEADLPELVEKTTKQVVSEIDTNNFLIQNINFKNILDDYKTHHKSLLAPKTKELLRNKEYQMVEVQAFERLLNPVGFSILPIEQDPYLLFSDFLINLAGNSNQNEVIKLKDKYYKITPLTIKKELSLSPTLANKEIKKLIDELRQKSNYIEQNIFKSTERVNLNTIMGYYKDDFEYNFLDDFDEK